MVIHLREGYEQSVGATAGSRQTAQLLKSAPFMDMLGRVACDVASPGGGCGWYHGVWQYLRLCGLVVTPDLHADFYHQAVVSGNPRPRTLISGTADYAMLAILWPNTRRAAEVSNVTVLDQCLTPLLISRWYAAELVRSVTTLQGDVLAVHASGSYDLIVTDAFVSRFEPGRRGGLLQAWSRMLSPGGRLVTTVRVEPAGAGGMVQASTEQAAAFGRRAAAAAERHAHALDVTPREIGERAERYAVRMRSYPLASPNALFAELQEAGFSVVWHEIAETGGEVAPATYLRLVAEKPL